MTTREPRAALKRAGGIAVRVFGGLVGVLALFVGVAVLVLRSDWGGERLRRQLVARVNDEIRGRLEIGRVSFGGDKLVLAAVTLRDPDGAAVAHVDRVEVGFSVRRLLHKELRLVAVAIERPVVRLVPDEDGSNWARAVAPRRRKPPQPPQPRTRGPSEGWVVRLDRFDLTNGDVSAATAGDDEDDLERAHLADIGVTVSARYATGNGSLDLTARVAAQSRRVPEGPIRFAGQVSRRGDVIRADVTGALLNGTLEMHGQLDAGALARSDGSVALAIPRQTLAGYEWGPFRVDGQARPGAAVKLDALLAVPGVELTAKDEPGPREGVRARLVVADLGLTGRALRALTGANIQPLAGRGEVKLALEAGRDAVLSAQIDGRFETLGFGTTAISQLTFGGRTARLSRRPGRASFELAVASISAGTSQLRGLGLETKLEQQDLTAHVQVTGPARVALATAGRFADDWRGFTLADLDLTFPGSRWTSDGRAALRFDEQELSLSNLRLSSEGQTLAVEGSRRGDKLAGRLALAGLRLGKLPTVVLDPDLHVDGQLDVDVTADGTTDTPRVVARAELKQGRYQGLSKIDLTLGGKLQNQDVYATLAVRAPFVEADGWVKTTTAPLEPDAPVDLALEVKQLELGRLLRGLEKPAKIDGRVNVTARLDGSAAAPRIDVVVDAAKLSVENPSHESVGVPSISVGHGRLHATYAQRAARAKIDLTSAHGGTLAVDAAARVNLGYPRGVRRLVVAKVPVTGKVTAKDLEVGWVAALNPRVEALGGQVTADARLAGTVAEPQVVGDVRWKNGELVTTAKPPSATPANRPRSGTATSPVARSAR